MEDFVTGTGATRGQPLLPEPLTLTLLAAGAATLGMAMWNRHRRPDAPGR
jgi:hypothetical protein